MHEIDTADAVDGEFQDTANPGTRVTADWLNDIQGNLLALLAAFGVAPEKLAYGQIAEAFAGIGLPGRAPITDLNALTRSGFYRSSATATGRPAGSAEGLVLSIFDTADSDDGLQVLVEKAADKLWIRRWTGAAWTDWHRPGFGSTGTAGGNFWKIHPDGTVEQWGKYSGGSATPAVNFPMAFPSACETVQITPYTGNDTQTDDFSVKIAGLNTRSTAGFTARCSAEQETPDTFRPATDVQFDWYARGR